MFTPQDKQNESWALPHNLESRPTFHLRWLVTKDGEKILQQAWVSNFSDLVTWKNIEIVEEK